MLLNIKNAPTSPLTTRSSYLNPNTGKVVNHNMEIFFTNVPATTPFEHSDVKNTHSVFVQTLAPDEAEAHAMKAINMLFESNAVEVDKPKYALIWHQLVGKENHRFENKPSILELSYH